MIASKLLRDPLQLLHFPVLMCPQLAGQGFNISLVLIFQLFHNLHLVEKIIGIFTGLSHCFWPKRVSC